MIIDRYNNSGNRGTTPYAGSRKANLAMPNASLNRIPYAEEWVSPVQPEGTKLDSRR